MVVQSMTGNTSREGTSESGGQQRHKWKDIGGREKNCSKSCYNYETLADAENKRFHILVDCK